MNKLRFEILRIAISLICRIKDDLPTDVIGSEYEIDRKEIWNIATFLSSYLKVLLLKRDNTRRMNLKENY